MSMYGTYMDISRLEPIDEERDVNDAEVGNVSSFYHKCFPPIQASCNRVDQFKLVVEFFILSLKYIQKLVWEYTICNYYL